MRSHWCNIYAVALALLLSVRASRAQTAAVGGVVLDISANGEQVDIRSVELRNKREKTGAITDYLVVRFANGVRSIRLPPGVLPLIAQYETSHRDDQLVISADNYLFGTSPEGPFRAVGASFSKTGESAKRLVVQYAHDLNIDKQFALALLEYDAYASSIICDDIDTSRLGNHPLSQDKHPDRVVTDILSDTQQRKAFRHVFRAFSTPPTCVGELFLSYHHDSNSIPQIAVHARRWFMGYRWDQEMTLLDDTLRAIADLPYKGLSVDLENNWDKYRRAFAELDELSSIAECLAILRILRTQHFDLYRRLQNKISQLPGTEYRGPRMSPGLQMRRFMTEADWHAQVIEQIGQVVENEMDADTALALRMYRWQALTRMANVDSHIEYPQAWNSGLDYFSKHGSPLLSAKIALVSALEAEPEGSLVKFREFFTAVEQQVPNSLGLWLQSLRWLDVYCNSLHTLRTEGHQELLRQQRAKVLWVVNTRVTQILSGKVVPAGATRFLEISFGTRLFDLETVEWGARDDNNNLNSQPLVDFVELIARVHQQSIQESSERNPDRLKLLAHHRYLGYLADKVPRSKPVVDRVRMAILASLRQSN